MGNKRMKAILSLLLVGVLTSVTFAGETEITMFSWEDRLPGFDMNSQDGYMFISKDDAQFGSAVTDGNWAMAVDIADGWKQGLQGGIGFGWDWTPYFPLLSEAANAGGVLRMDVTTSNALANVPMSGGIQLALFIQGESVADPGFFGYTIGYELIDAVYYNPANVGPGAPTYATSTLEWDLSLDVNGMPTWFPGAWDSEQGGWADMRFHTNSIGGAINTGIIIIDNIRAVIVDEDNCSWGDFNLDGTVDIADYTVWADHFGTVSGDHVDGDGNDDGVVDLADYTIWADNFGQVMGVGVGIPEPATLSLLSLGWIALIRRK